MLQGQIRGLLAWRPLVNQTGWDPDVPRWAPPCDARVDIDDTIPWRDCQMPGGYPLKGEQGQSFRFTGLDWGNGTRWVEDPYKYWLLCGRGGSCMGLNALAFLRGGLVSVARVNYTEGRGSNLSVVPRDEVRNYVPPTQVCVWPPFMFLLTNLSGPILNCNATTCS